MQIIGPSMKFGKEKNMTHGLSVASAALVAAAGFAYAQDAPLFEQGMELYERECEVCHLPTGLGIPPGFPALAGNSIVVDVNRIVSNIHEGRGNMPAFPTLNANELAALATYVRGAWENSFAPAEPDEVAAILEGLGGAAEPVSIWDGVYSQEQAKRGEVAYHGPCGLCHGRRLDGAPDDPDMRPSPPLSRAKFTRNWSGRSLASLYAYARATMPQSNPGYMPDQTYVDIIAHMLSMTGAPAGETELTPDPALLATIVIGPKPK